MAEQERIQKSAPAQTARSDPEAETKSAEANSTGEELKAKMDDLLDEIDEVLETNAEEFVNSYIQKGGE